MASTLASIADGYAPPSSHWDELLPGSGDGPSPTWQPVLRILDEIGGENLARREELARRIVEEHGVTYNVYSDPRGPHRLLELDPIPFVVGPADWARIEEGIAQRGRLLELVLADLYGPQSLLTSGALPAELAFGHASYLRAARRLAPAGGRWLTTFAADLSRGPDGQWWVMGDNTQAPSGSGYVLETRLTLARALPELFRSLPVQRIASYFAALRDALGSLAPSHRDNPRIVLLTPGPYNETYFEHSFLARYLGFTLVEGSDLTVRDSRVFLKTLEGLYPVDVIVRRMDDGFCDPLELRGDSAIGIPGLVQAVRARNVAIANALGTGVVENPALMAFMPSLCKLLLGEELKLPNVASWWCGHERERAHVMANMDSLVLKHCGPNGVARTIFGDRLSPVESEDVAARIRQRPWEWTGQQRLAFSTSPCLEGGRLAPRHAQIRTFAVASESGWTLMPGGMARSAPSERNLVVGMQHGGRTKDTIVLSSGPAPEPAPSLIPPSGGRVELRRGGRDLLSRVADNLYWLGRTVERADGLARLLRGCLLCLAEEGGAGEVPEMTTLLRVFADQGYMPSHHVEAWSALSAAQDPEGAHPPSEQPPSVGAAPPELEREILALIDDPGRPNSLRSLASALHRTAWLVRDRISLDSWRILGGLQEAAFFGRTPGAPGFGPEQALEMLNGLVQLLTAFGGLTMESMTRGQGWRFLDMGRRLERGLNTASLLRAGLGQQAPHEASVLRTVLVIAESAMTYRVRYLANYSPEAVLDLLLADEANPRSIAFQLAALDAHAAQLPRDQDAPQRTESERLALGMLAALRLASVEELATAIHDGQRTALANLLDRLRRDLHGLSDSLSHAYFAHLSARRQPERPFAP